MTSFVLVGAALVHFVLIFFTLAPDNPVTDRYGERIDAYVRPEFDQNWRLFAPNPTQRDEAVGVRVRTGGEGGAGRTGGWVNLTAQDIEAIRGNLAPSHVHHDMLRRAWTAYVKTHNERDRPTNRVLGEVAADYLKRVVLQRIGREWQGERIVGVQIAGRFTMVPPPPWSSEKPPDTTKYRILPWWPVANQDYRGL